MRLGTILRKWRLMSEIDIREAAKMIGIDPATYLRLEQGKMPSAETLRTVLFFLIGDEQ